MKKHEARISATAIAEAKNYLDEVAEERMKEERKSFDDSMVRRSLDQYTGKVPWRGLNIIAVFAEEELGYDGIWRPIRFNQETEFGDLEDWTFRKGDWADDN